MARKVAISNLTGSTIDILNVIRQNASQEYQDSVPEVTTEHDIPKVGEVIYGTPALTNQFINALVTRIASVVIRSLSYTNPYADFKKGYLEFGETIESVYVEISKAREFSVEKAPAREFKRTVPDVKSAFHVMNYRVQYPITIQDEDLRTAFLSSATMQDFITRITQSIYTAAEYDEYLLFKYLLIKAVASGKMYPISIGDGTNMADAAIQFRAASNQLQFVSTKYNAAGVHTVTPKNDQYIFMDSTYNAQYDVNVLAAAFNMEKADFMGRLRLIDDWTTFDNDRFDVIRANSDQIEEVTDEELALMKNVKAVLIDREWFQVYDNLDRMTSTPVASGLYYNYFYNVWKTLSSSPFANAIVFVTDAATIDAPATVTATVQDKTQNEDVIILSVVPQFEATLENTSFKFHQTEALTSAGIAVQPYGAIFIPKGQSETNITLEGDINGTKYTAGESITSATTVGTQITLNKA